MDPFSPPQPDCVLLPASPCLGQHRDFTITASNTTSTHEKIEVSFCPATPPHPSKIYVHFPERALAAHPRVIRAVEDIFLLRVAVGGSANSSTATDDYFVYRAGNQRRPSLLLLQRPHPSFHDVDVGLLSRGTSRYTVAALIATGTPVYDLHILHSENPSEWIYRKVSVTEPQRSIPLQIPRNCSRLLYHQTSTVISLGGEAGTIGWVDLWQGILLCDVLCDEPTLREVPVPVPLDLVSCHHGLGTELGCPTPFRGIAFIKGGSDNLQDCLKLVHLETKTTLVPGDDYDDVGYRMRDWTIVTYTNTAMTTSWKDWRTDCWVEASDITMDTQVKSELMQSGLLGSAPGQALRNLLVAHPAPDVCAATNHEGIVYLMARKAYQHSESWMLALDTRIKKLLGAAKFDDEWLPYSYPKYWPSGISKYIRPNADDVKRRMLGLIKD